MKLLVCLSLLALVNVQSLTFSVSNSTDVVRRQHLTANFGPQDYHVSGRVQVADPAELCVLPPPGFYTTDIRVMFILRGNCTFYQKAQNAMALGASAVVIANAQIIGADDPFLLGYPADLSPSAITIPVVCVAKATFDNIIAANNDSHGLVTVELKNRQGHDSSSSSSSGGNYPPHRHDSSSSSSSGQSGPVFSSTADMSTGVSGGDSEDGHDDGKPRPPHRAPRSWMLAAGITAIVASSCLCGFCIGRHCGAGRRCSRHRAAHAASVAHVAPVAPLVVHQGYTQVDMESAPAGYYGQEMMPMEAVIVPSAPAYSPSAPSSAEIRYA